MYMCSFEPTPAAPTGSYTTTMCVHLPRTKGWLLVTSSAVLVSTPEYMRKFQPMPDSPLVASALGRRWNITQPWRGPPCVQRLAMGDMPLPDWSDEGRNQASTVNGWSAGRLISRLNGISVRVVKSKNEARLGSPTMAPGTERTTPVGRSLVALATEPRLPLLTLMAVVACVSFRR